jgi:transposase
MRGKAQAQPDFLTVVNLHACVPADHPLRAIKRRVDAVLENLSPHFDDLYEELGRPSLPPEQLLKARVLTALYSVRSERLFCEQLGYNLLWLWFLDRAFREGSFDRSVFAKNYERVLSAEVAQLFFLEVYDLSRAEGWTSDAHFTADGTLLEAWASLKSFVRKAEADAVKVQAAKDEDPGNPSVNFRGEPRRNDTHQSTTDPESVLYRKAHGKEARLCFGGHILMENRHGLCAEFTIHNPITEPEPVVALRQLEEHPQWHEGVRPATVGADKGYHQKDFVRGCRARGLAPHAACKEGVKVAGLDGRTTRQSG